YLRVVLFACKAAIQSIDTADENNTKRDILIAIVIEVLDDLADQYLVNGESGSIILLCGKLVGDALESSQSSLDLAAFALIISGRYRGQDLLPVHLWIKRGLPR